MTDLNATAAAGEQLKGNNMLCQGCGVTAVDSPASFRFRLDCGSNCLICPGCFSECQATRQCSQIITCPNTDCQQCHCSSWTVLYPNETTTKRTRTGVERTTVTAGAKVSSGSIRPHPQQDPIRNHYGMNESAREKFIGFSFSVAKGESFTTQSVLLAKNMPTTEMGEDQINCLETIARHLHGLLISNDAVDNDRPCHPLGQESKEGDFDVDEKTLFNYAMEDYSVLRRFIHALSYGEHLHQFPIKLGGEDRAGFDSPKWRRLAVTTFAIADIIRTVRSTNAGIIKSTVDALLAGCDANSAIYSFLNRLGICSSWKTVRRHEKKNFGESLKQGVSARVQLSKYNGIGNHNDNCGYKTGGKNVGYLQTVLIIWVVYSVSMLVRLNIYPAPEASAAACLSRKRKSFEEDRDGLKFEDLAGATIDDHIAARVCLLSIIDDLLAMRAKGTLCTYQQAAELLSHNVYDWIETLPDQRGKKLLDDVLVEDVTAAAMEDDTMDVEDDGISISISTSNHHPLHRPTILEANSAFTDVPWMKDLNKIEVAVELADYTAQMQQFVLEQDCRPEEKYLEDLSVEPILQSVPAVIACDGVPAANLIRSKIKDPETMKQEVVWGIMHLILHGYKAFGSIFAQSHLTAFFSLWRRTKGQLDYVLDSPGDPDQIADESYGFLLGLLLCAIDGCITAKKVATNGPAETVEINAAEVFEHMASRGARYPLVFRINLSVILASTLILLHKSEFTASGDLYFKAMRLLFAPLCCDNQKTYAFLITEFFVEWYEKSDAAKTLFKEAFLFRKTRNGANIASDRFVEHNVFYVRSYTGKKVHGAHHANKATTTMFLLNNRMKAKSMAKDETANPYTDTAGGRQQQKFDKVALESFLYAHDLRLYGVEEPRYVPAKPFSVRTDMDQLAWQSAAGETFDGKMFDPTGTYQISSKHPLIYYYGRERSERFFEAFALLGDRQDPSRKGEDADLSKIDPDGQSAAEADKNELEKMVSVDVTFLMEKGVISVKELKKELEFLNKALEDKGLQKVRISGKKSVLVSNVVEARKMLNGKEEDWLESRRNTLTITPPDYNGIVAAECKQPYLDPALGQQESALVFSRQNHIIDATAIAEPVINTTTAVIGPIVAPQNADSELDQELDSMLSDMQGI